MKILANRHYCSLVTENVDAMCQTKTAGRGWGVYVLVVLRGGGWSRRPNKAEVCVLVLGDRRPCYSTPPPQKKNQLDLRGLLLRGRKGGNGKEEEEGRGEEGKEGSENRAMKGEWGGEERGRKRQGTEWEKSRWKWREGIAVILRLRFS